MNNVECNDWRIAVKTTLVKEIPPAFLGGPPHKAGTPVYLTHFIKSKEYRYLGFITPSVVAMALNVAIRSSIAAFNIKKKLMYDDCFGPIGKFKNISKRTTAELFDFFENCMISVNFSFQAIEVFCNSIISKDPNKLITINKKDKNINKRAYEIERDLSTEEKIIDILPILLNVSISKKDLLWQKFIDLKFVRDSTVHLKSSDMYSKFENSDKESLFYLFLKNNPFEYPRSSFEVIHFFNKVIDHSPWEEHISELLKT